MADGTLAHVLRPMNEGDLGMVLAWRNHPEVRRHMFSTQKITAQEHGAWFLRAARDGGRHLLIYLRDGAPAGFVGLTVGHHPGVADWGFYAAPHAPRGTGRPMCQAALEHAFGSLGMHKVCGQAIESNRQSIDLHSRLGFQREGTLREQHFDGEHHRDVLCFGLLSREWTRIT